MGYKLGWKVVGEHRVDEKTVELTSSIIMTSLRYDHGKVTVPMDGWGPLCVFCNKERALRFARNNQAISPRLKLVVFPCAYLPSRAQRVWKVLSCSQKKRERELENLPSTTVLAREVILLKEGAAL